jgi:protein O-GlcNAc transferase
MNRKQRRAQRKAGVVPLQVAHPGVQRIVSEAVRLHHAGQLDQAERLYRQVVSIDPRHADSWHNLGAIAHKTGRYEMAADLICRAIEIDGSFATFHLSAGLALSDLGRLDEAAACFRKAIRLQPGDAEAHHRLGSVLLRLSLPGKAEPHLRGAIERKPDYAEACCELGRALQGQGRRDEAEAYYRKALALRPDLAQQYNATGVALLEQGRLDEARAHFRLALDLRPDYAPSHTNLGTASLTLGDHATAIACYRRALSLQPDNTDTHTNLIFALNFDPAIGPQAQQQERRDWYARHARSLAEPPSAHGNSPMPERRLRVGYLSAHFRRHAASYAFAPVLIHHDPEQFEIFCYSDTVTEDDLTQILRGRATNWRHCVGVPDDRLAEIIRADEIDICVDLVGHMHGNRLLVMARKPAPVQVTAWGEPTGTGLPTIDYLLADPVLVPQRWRPLLSETVVDLPCFLCHWTPEPLPAPGPLPGLRNGHVTFGSFNRLDKISSAVLQSWGAILRAVPGARLVIKSPRLSDVVARDHLTAALAQTEVDAGRITMIGYTSRAEHLAAYREIDLALDPFPHGGGMTTLEALAMGVPVIAAPGETISSRLAAACLAALGLTDFIAEDRSAYIALAAARAADLGALANLRRDLPSRMARSPVGDGPGYARAVEATYREMWRGWCLNKVDCNNRQGVECASASGFDFH